jgi:serine/threonine protein kinase
LPVVEMALEPNSRFGPYEVVASIGAGGMGEVYRARDAKLHRDVALKVLPTEVAMDAERLARFRREAQLLAALNHPNIAHVYGLEESDGTTALVMELVHGEDLARRLARGPVSVIEALAIARQIAAALESAHDAGIIHRDLKPANIKLSDDGAVKVLDFGLAKAVDAERQGELGNSPTITTPAMTQAGVILGTAAYMSPEQAKGRPVDKRADVWAFGCVLYEMLTGVRAFEGDDVTDTMAGILRAEPDWSKLPNDVPESVRQLIRGCLEKDRRSRVPDIGVARYLLDERFSRNATQAVPSRPRPQPAALIAGAIALGVALGVVAMLTMPRFRSAAADSASPTGRFEVTPALPFYSTLVGGTLAIASDASFIVYVSGASAGDTSLVVRPLDQLTGTRLEGTNNARFPFVSPDNKWIGFFGAGEVKKVAVSGGAPVRICSYAGIARGATWGDDGTIVFGSTLDLGLMQVPATGGTPKPITRTLDQANRPMHVFPSFLPGGDSILFSVVPPGGSPSIAAIDVKTGAVSTVLDDGGFVPTYLPSGHLVFDRVGELRAMRFDRRSKTVSGDAVTVASGLFQSAQGFSPFAISQNGVLVYQPASGRVGVTSRTLVWVDRRGIETPLGLPTRSYEVARVSPDGTRIAVDSRDEDSDIWIWDTVRRTLSRLTIGTTDEMAPLWSTDGQYVLYSSNRTGLPNIFRQRADGAGSVERLTDGRTTQFLTSIGNGGSELALFEFTDAGEDISIADLRGGKLPVTATKVLIKNDSNHRYGAEISPDGNWLAFHSNESGRYEVYVRPFPDVDGGRWQISANGGTRAAWSRDSKELFYLDADGRLTSVKVSVNDKKFSAGTPVQVLKTAYVAGQSARGLDLRSYDVSADGQRFLMIKDESKAPVSSSTPIVVATNWLDELKRRVPPAR